MFQVAIITGAATGIGECMARVFVKHGAKVIVADILDGPGSRVCAELGQDVATFVHCDVTNESDVEAAVNTAISLHGKLDIMVNNAAIAEEPKLSILDNDKAEFERVVAVNLTGAFLGAKHAARAMIPAQCGSIITVGSVCSAVGGVATHSYTSSKHAVVGLTKNVAAELGEYGIRTKLTVDLFKMDYREALRVYSNLKGVALRPEDVADAAVFLGSDDSRYVSGHNLALDGGFTAINPAFGLFAKTKVMD
ncbi:unnamed protein product [Thlaspi arvense]|uniref:Uncharacterized protein n=1 Tax=Thlaspi arvense TaxID=13288 RepID=A0AAU9T8B5_THLAR|nr:unnamed protein product [Thlaspi arvense]